MVYVYSVFGFKLNNSFYDIEGFIVNLNEEKWFNLCETLDVGSISTTIRALDGEPANPVSVSLQGSSDCIEDLLGFIFLTSSAQFLGTEDSLINIPKVFTPTPEELGLISDLAKKYGDGKPKQFITLRFEH